WPRDWSSDVCSSDLFALARAPNLGETEPGYRAARVTPNETPSQKARCKRQKLLLGLLRRRRAPTTCRRSRFPGEAPRHKLAAALGPPLGALAAALRRARRVPRNRPSGT